MSQLFKGAALFIGGALVGAAAALLLTPKTGEEMRKELADLADEVKKNAQEYCEQLKQNFGEANACADAEPKAAKSKKEEA